MTQAAEKSDVQLRNWLALHHTPYIGPMGVQSLFEIIEKPSDLFESIADISNQFNFNQKSLSYLRNPDWEKIDLELKWADDKDNHILPLDHSDYPEQLKEIPDPPTVLYVRGDPTLLKSIQISMVGSRNPSATGKDTAVSFAHYLASKNFTITSGLALGIDFESHRGALAAKGKTIAVTATGLDRVYPARNKDIAHEIANNGGALVSEYPLGTTPRKENFPRRNRIISGLSLGTLVVEAAQQSGSLITARYAGEHGREVFAIPGSIHNPLAKGCHTLIRQGAKLVEKGEHILEELGHIAPQPLQLTDANDGKNKSQTTNSGYSDILNHIGFEPTTIDTVIQRSGLTPEAVSSMLVVLELQGEVESLPGGKYSRYTKANAN